MPSDCIRRCNVLLLTPIIWLTSRTLKPCSNKKVNCPSSTLYEGLPRHPLCTFVWKVKLFDTVERWPNWCKLRQTKSINSKVVSSIPMFTRCLFKTSHLKAIPSHSLDHPITFKAAMISSFILELEIAAIFNFEFWIPAKFARKYWVLTMLAGGNGLA